MQFSKRKGLLLYRDTVQKDDMDDDLRVGLWNVLTVCVWRTRVCGVPGEHFGDTVIFDLFQGYWHTLFKLPLDRLEDRHFNVALEEVRTHFFNCEWFSVYDLIEFTAQNCPEELRDDLVNSCNRVLEKELSGYRLVGLQITDIVSPQEGESIQSALDATTNKYVGAREHLETALKLLSSRTSPDFRNSIKESISAVEAICVAVSGESSATLGGALKSHSVNSHVHPALNKAFLSLYGYTSDSGGIRHALIDGGNTPTYSEARFMLVACTAFINYLLSSLDADVS